MTTPTIELVRPAVGWSAGRTLVEITGTGFRMPVPTQPLPRTVSGKRPHPPPTVRVLFDGLPAPRVWVVSPTLLRCWTPRHPPDRKGVDGKTVVFGRVDLVIENLADDGTVLAGEVATATGAYTFVRPRLDGEGEWYRVLVALLDHFRNLVVENVASNPSIDFDRETGDFRNFVKMAEGPGIAVTRVAYPQSDLDAQSETPLVAAVGDPNGHLLERKAVASNDLTATLVVISDNQRELLNLGEILEHVFLHASILLLDANPLDASAGVVGYSLIPTGPYQLADRVGQTNMQTAEQPVAIRRILSSDLPGAPGAGIPEEALTTAHEGTRGVTMPAETFTGPAVKKG